MSSDERLDELLDRWEELRDQGTPISADELCRDDLDLLDEVRLRTAALLEMDPWIETASWGMLDATATRPERVGPYQVLSELDSGGMGVVYLCQQDRPQRKVALKMILPGKVSRRTLLRFQNEAEVLGRLQHPGIAQIFEAGTVNLGRGLQPFFAMEFIDGRPLGEYADAERLDARARLRLVIQVCEAVHHAHQKGVIHRDLKPSNILVDAAGRPRVLDFGVARATDADIQLTSIQTDVRQLIGTVPYMSPEQVAADPSRLDTRSDVYALGVVCYELLTGRLPYAVRGKSLPEAVRIIEQEDPTPLSQVTKLFRGDLETILAKALEKDKTRRYQSASDFAADLDRYLLDEPIQARPASAWYQARKFARRNRGLVAGVAAAFVALFVGLIGVTLALFRATSAEELALANAARANDNFEMAWEFVDDYYTRAAGNPRWKELGLQPVRYELLDAAVVHYRTLAAPPSNDGAIEHKLAQALHRLSQNSADKIASLAAAREAVAIWERMAASFPESPDYAGGLAAGLEQLAACTDGRERAEVTERALQLRESLVRDHPTDDHRSQLATSYYNWGLENQRAKRYDEAVNFAQKACDIRHNLAERSTGDAENRRLLAMAEGLVGRLHHRSHRLEQAEESWRRSCELTAELASHEPDNLDLHQQLCTIHNDLGNVRMARGRLADGVEAYQQGAAALERSLDRDRIRPTVTAAQYVLASTYRAMGESLVKANQPAEAMAAFERCNLMRAELVRAQPDSRVQRGEWGAALANLGLLAAAQGDLDSAVTRFQSAADEVRVALSMAPPSAQPDRHAREHTDYLDYILAELARAHRAVGHPDAAAAATLERSKLCAGKPDQLYALAAEWALCVPLVARGKNELTPGERDQRQAFANRAIQSLRQAIAAGFKDPQKLANDPDFAALGESGEVMMIVEELRGKQ